MQSSFLSQVLSDGAAPTKSYEDRKRSHLDTARLCESEGLLFLPMVAEGVGGGWGPNAERVFHDLAKKIAAVSNQHPDRVQEDMYQSFSTILHREGA
eukprot:6094076-Karenia_brevis.AAC.1